MSSNNYLGKCCCIVCKDIRSIKGIHSHYISAHTEDGAKRRSENGKLGAQVTIANNTLATANEAKYKENPKRCKNPQCNTSLPYRHRHNKFCNQSCAAKYNNANRSPDVKTGPKPGTPYTYRKPAYTKVSRCIECGKWHEGRNRLCSPECRHAFFSQLAKNNPALGGNKNNKAYGWYESRIAGRVYLESSYEYRVAVELDANNIQWIRPKYLPYGDSKRYFPDFYLIEFDVYLDPKNDYLIQVDSEKIQKVKEENGVTVLVLDEQHLTWNAIKSLI